MLFTILKWAHYWVIEMLSLMHVHLLTSGHPVVGCGVGGVLGAPDDVLHVLGGALGGDLDPSLSLESKGITQHQALIGDIHLSWF